LDEETTSQDEYSLEIEDITPKTTIKFRSERELVAALKRLIKREQITLIETLEYKFDEIYQMNIAAAIKSLDINEDLITFLIEREIIEIIPESIETEG
jgi:hypothetical protein